MTDLTTLIAKLEAATGPDRELDALIAAMIEPHHFDAPGFKPMRPIPAFRIDPSGDCIRLEGGGIMGFHCFPAVTASIDAAVALAERVLPGTAANIRLSGSGGAHAQLFTHPVRRGLDPKARHANPSIALVIAILRAKQAEGKV